MSRSRVFAVGIELGDDPADIGIEYGRRLDGTEYALLRLGQVTIHPADAPVAALRALAAAATELADWREQQTTAPIGVAA